MAARTQPVPTEMGIAVGQRLRALRKAKGMSVDDVERASGRRWSGSSIGMYERAERTLSLTNLSDLAAFYDVPMATLLGIEGPTRPANGERRLTFDLVALAGTPPRAAQLRAFVRSIALLRGDHNGRVLTLRGSDLPAIAALLDVDSPDAAIKLLDNWGVLLVGAD